jgi:hypothetical protein
MGNEIEDFHVDRPADDNHVQFGAVDVSAREAMMIHDAFGFAKDAAPSRGVIK